MQQRVGLARAFATDAEILLMDEPFSALDPLIRNRLQDELLQLQDKMHCTIVFVSHDLEEAVKLGNTITIMEGGRIVQTGTPEDIVLRPANGYVADFVAHLNPLSVLTAGDAMVADAGPGDPARTVGARVAAQGCAAVLRRDRRAGVGGAGRKGRGADQRPGGLCDAGAKRGGGGIGGTRRSDRLGPRLRRDVGTGVERPARGACPRRGWREEHACARLGRTLARARRAGPGMRDALSDRARCRTPDPERCSQKRRYEARQNTLQIQGCHPASHGQRDAGPRSSPKFKAALPRVLRRAGRGWNVHASCKPAFGGRGPLHRSFGRCARPCRTGRPRPMSDELGAELLVLVIGDGAGVAELAELGELVGDAEADGLAQRLAGMLGLLDVAVSHPPPLGKEIGEDPEYRGGRP